MAPKGTQFKPKGHQNEPKGCQRGAKSEPEINKNTTKNRNLEKGRKREVKCNIFWGQFWHIFGKKCIKKSMRKTTQKNMSKNLKIKQKKQARSYPQKRRFWNFFCKGGSSKISFLLEKNNVFWRSRVLKVCIHLKNVRGKSKQKHCSNKYAKNI